MKKLFLVFFLSAVLCLPFLALAADTCEDYCANIETETPPEGQICICSPLESTSFEGIINSFIDFIFRIAIVLVPLMIIIGGVLFVSAGGNQEQITKARNIILWTLIGFAIVLLARGISDLLEVILGISG